MDSFDRDTPSLSSSASATRLLLWESRFVLLIALLSLLFAIALTVRTYMPCPSWDEWAEVNAVANGAGLSSFTWLWSEHNEHRLLITRLFMLLDMRVFGGKNASLFVETYLFQIAAWGAVCFAVERFTSFPRFLQTTLEGLFGFCLFHLNQAENLTWAFQVSFILPFSAATITLLAVAFFDRLSRPALAAVLIGLAPLLAALNLAGGFLIGPVSIVFAAIRRIPTRYVAVIAVLFAASAAVYLTGYKASDPNHKPLQALLHGKEVCIYVLTYLGASWTRLLPHKERLTAFLSLLCFAFLTAKAFRRRGSTDAFEWFCIAECSLVIAVALLTALGRLQFGVGQAYAGRYQTPAMLYWAALAALVLIAVWRRAPSRFVYLQSGLLAVIVLSAATCIPIWRQTVRHGDLLRSACRQVMHGNADEAAAKLLYGSRRDLAPGVAYFHRLWHQ